MPDNGLNGLTLPIGYNPGKGSFQQTLFGEKLLTLSSRYQVQTIQQGLTYKYLEFIFMPLIVF